MKNMGWMFVVLPNLIGCIIMLFMALIINNLSAKRKYPVFWKLQL